MTRKKTQYNGTVEIGGYTLKTRLCEFLGDMFEVPEHITPVVQKKNGKVSHSCWQVRISKPYKSFQKLGEAIKYLSKEILNHPPKREAKFVFKEMKSKRFPTGLVGGHFQSKIRYKRAVQEIRLNLIFKCHTMSAYLGTILTCDETRYRDAFIQLFTLRKWLETLAKERDFSWMNENKTLDVVYEDIPLRFKEEHEVLAGKAIRYDGLEAYMKNLKEMR